MSAVPETRKTTEASAENIRCPACGSEASYRYGKAWNGKARRICLMCNRQFVAGVDRPHGTPRPECPVCRQPMHVYRRQGSVVRYRCRNYPDCRNYVKVETALPDERQSDESTGS